MTAQCLALVSWFFASVTFSCQLALISSLHLRTQLASGNWPAELQLMTCHDHDASEGVRRYQVCITNAFFPLGNKLAPATRGCMASNGVHCPWRCWETAILQNRSSSGFDSRSIEAARLLSVSASFQCGNPHTHAFLKRIPKIHACCSEIKTMFCMCL